MRVDPDDAPRLPRGRGEPAQRAHRDRVVAAEDERPGALPHRSFDDRGQLRARGEDLGHEAGPLVGEGETLRLRRHHVAAVGDVEPDAGEPLFEPRVADRRRAHVDAAALLAEVERGADDRNGTVHGAEPIGAAPKRVTGCSLTRGGAAAREPGARCGG